MRIRRLFDRFNNHLAMRITLWMSTMECVYLFMAWSLLPLAAPQIQPVVFYISGGILQLIALPLILLGQNLLSQSADRRAAKDHETILTNFKMLHETVANVHEITAKHDALDAKLNRIEKLVAQKEPRQPRKKASKV